MHSGRSKCRIKRRRSKRNETKRNETKRNETKRNGPRDDGLLAEVRVERARRRREDGDARERTTARTSSRRGRVNGRGDARVARTDGLNRLPSRSSVSSSIQSFRIVLHHDHLGSRFLNLLRRQPSTRRRKSAREAWIEDSKTSRRLLQDARPRRRKSAETTVTTETTTETASARGGGARPAVDLHAFKGEPLGRENQVEEWAAKEEDDECGGGVEGYRDERGERGGGWGERGGRRGGERGLVAGTVLIAQPWRRPARMLFSNEWRARYNASEIAAVAEIYSLLCKAAGCTTGVAAMELQRSDCLTIGFPSRARLRCRGISLLAKIPSRNGRRISKGFGKTFWNSSTSAFATRARVKNCTTARCLRPSTRLSEK